MSILPHFIVILYAFTLSVVLSPSTNVRAASPLSSVALILPENNTVIAGNHTVTAIGIDDLNVPKQSGYTTNVTVSLTFPNGTQLLLGGIFGGCQTFPGTSYSFGVPCRDAGVYGVAVNTTYFIGDCSMQSWTSIQSFPVYNAFTVLSPGSPSSPCLGSGCPVNGTETTTTVAFASKPTGTVSGAERSVASSGSLAIVLGALLSGWAISSV